MIPSTLKANIEQALRDASRSHHDYEENVLDGVRDEYWSGWYDAYVLGRLGDFTSPTELSRLLETVSGDGDWYLIASNLISSKFNL